MRAGLPGPCPSPSAVGPGRPTRLLSQHGIGVPHGPLLCCGRRGCRASTWQEPRCEESSQRDRSRGHSRAHQEANAPSGESVSPPCSPLSSLENLRSAVPLLAWLRGPACPRGPTGARPGVRPSCEHGCGHLRQLGRVGAQRPPSTSARAARRDVKGKMIRTDFLWARRPLAMALNLGWTDTSPWPDLPCPCSAHSRRWLQSPLGGREARVRAGCSWWGRQLLTPAPRRSSAGMLS